MAQEIKKGTKYNSTVDIYSSGLLFLELVVPNSSEDDTHFKLRLLCNFANRIFTNNFDKKALFDALSESLKKVSPEFANMIESMIEDDPSKRMSWE